MADGKKGRKVGRNKVRCDAYRKSQRAEFNKARRLIKYLRKHSGDAVAWSALERVAGTLYSAQRSELGVAAFLSSKGAA